MNDLKKTDESTKKQLKNRSLRIILVVLVILVIGGGVGLLLYPTIADYWNELHSSRVISTYSRTIDEMEDDSKQMMLDAAHKYNMRLSHSADFFLSEDEMAEYESILDVSGTGIMGYVEIPAINVTLPIYHGVSDGVLQIAAGHLPGSSIPVGGEGTHAVISGHRGLVSAKLFSDLDQLGEGDVFYINILGDQYTYQVDQVRKILPTETDELRIRDGQDYVTLMTCTPYGINTHRLLVRGTRVETEKLEEIVHIIPDAKKISPRKVLPYIVAPLFIIILSVLFYLIFKKQPEQVVRKRLKKGENHE